MECFSCGKDIADNAKFCRYCSASQATRPSVIACKKCGIGLSLKTKFCRECGEKVEPENAAPILNSSQQTQQPIKSVAHPPTPTAPQAVSNPNGAIYNKKIGITGTHIAIGLVVIVLLAVLVFYIKSKNDVTEPAEVDSVQQATTDEAKKNKLTENADSRAVAECTLNVNRIIYDLVFNGGRVPPSIEIIGYYLQAKMQLHGVKLDQSKQTQYTVIAFDGTGIDSDSLKRLPLCVEKVPLSFSDGTKEDYLVAYLYDSQNLKYLSIQPIAPDESGKLIEWYNKVAAKNVREFGSSPNASVDYVAELKNPQTHEQNVITEVNQAQQYALQQAEDEAKEELYVLQQQKEQAAKHKLELKKAKEELALAKLEAETEQKRINAQHVLISSTFEGVDGSINFENGFTIQTVRNSVGSPIISTAKHRSGSSSIFFNKTSALVLNASNLNIGLSDFSIRFNFMTNGTQNQWSYILFGSSISLSNGTATNGGGLTFRIGGSTIVGNNFNDNQWHQVVIGQSEGFYFLYVDGMLQGKVAIAINNRNNDRINLNGLVIGHVSGPYVENWDNSFTGWIDDFQITTP